MKVEVGEMLAVVEMVEAVVEEAVMSCRGKAVFRGVVRLSSGSYLAFGMSIIKMPHNPDPSTPGSHRRIASCSQQLPAFTLPYSLSTSNS